MDRLRECEFWDEVEGNQEKEMLLLKSFFMHKFDFECFEQPNIFCILGSKQIAETIFKILPKYSCSDIIAMLKREDWEYVIRPKDIPQFSNFDVCYFDVPMDLYACGMEMVDFAQMGYLLRNNGARNKVADMKYGENQAKTAAQLGLCCISRSKGIKLSVLGKVFNKLPRETKELIKPRMCLYIPLIQMYFVKERNDDLLMGYMRQLSESTFKRRITNVKYLINLITETLDYELYRVKH